MDSSNSIKGMEAVIHKLEMQISMEKEKSANLQAYSSKAARETQEIISRVRKFCNTILENMIATGKITASNIQAMSILELLDASEKAYRQEHIDTQVIFSKFSQKFEEKNQMLNQNKMLISQLQTKLARCTDYSNLDNPSTDPNIAQNAAAVVETSTPTVTQKAVVPDDDFEKALNVESAAEQVSASVDKKPPTTTVQTKDSGETVVKGLYGSKDVNKIEKDLDDLDWLIIEMVGSRGVSEKPIIISELSSSQNYSKSKVRNTINAEISKAIFTEYRVNTGLRWFNLIEFTAEGELLYKGRFNKDPVEPEISLVRKAHENIVHGYGIKDTASVLGTIGFKDISIDRKANYIRLDDTHSSIPDIIAVKDGETFYFEYECGNHTAADFNDKCHKLTMITNNLYFVVPNRETLQKIQGQIKTWISSEGGASVLKNVNINVFLTTSTSLVKGIWRVIFNMDSENPIINSQDDDDTSSQTENKDNKKEVSANE